VRTWVLLIAVCSAAACLAADPGFVEEFSGAGNLGSFFSGATLANPGTGGAGGAGDGFLVLSRQTSGNFAAATISTHFIGDLVADGVTGYRVYLNDINTDEAFDIHVALGSSGTNFWIYNQSFLPPNGSWAAFDVSISDASQWTRVQGSGTFSDALRFCDRFQIRQDASPFGSGGDVFVGDLGIDRVEVLPEPTTMIGVLLGLLVYKRIGTRAG
jgi:hypothetical protein